MYMRAPSHVPHAHSADQDLVGGEGGQGALDRLERVMGCPVESCGADFLSGRRILSELLDSHPSYPHEACCPLKLSAGQSHMSHSLVRSQAQEV